MFINELMVDTVSYLFRYASKVITPVLSHSQVTCFEATKRTQLREELWYFPRRITLLSPPRVVVNELSGNLNCKITQPLYFEKYYLPVLRCQAIWDLFAQKTRLKDRSIYSAKPVQVPYQTDRTPRWRCWITARRDFKDQARGLEQCHQQHSFHAYVIRSNKIPP